MDFPLVYGRSPVGKRRCINFGLSSLFSKYKFVDDGRLGSADAKPWTRLFVVFTFIMVLFAALLSIEMPIAEGLKR